MVAFTRLMKRGAAASLLLGAVAGGNAQAVGYTIQSLNTPNPLLVTTGDTVRVNVTGPSTALALSSVKKLNGRIVNFAFLPDPTPGSMTGTVPGLRPGDNVLQVFDSKTALVPQAQIRVTRALAPTAACNSLAAPGVVVNLSVLRAAAGNLPEHCQIDGAINQRIGVDGRPYAINFRLRMPTAWNARFYMGGGGGTNGSLVDPTSVLPQGFATIGTDSGHNASNNNNNAGGSGAFGVDPQARLDFGYNSYDQVTQAGKALVNGYYGAAPSFSYYVGCSEGGREAMVMSQRFPAHYDGIVAGDPGLHLPLAAMAGSHVSQVFAGVATAAGLFDANGVPLLNKTYTDPDLMLVRNAVLAACDNLDGLVDGIVDNIPACTPALVNPQLTALQCPGAKTASCLTSNQITALQTAMAGPKNSLDQQLYNTWPWDGGISGQSGTTFNQGWRSWWLGSFNSATNNSTKLTLAGNALPLIFIAPPAILPTSALVNYMLHFNFDTDTPKIYATSGIYTQSPAQFMFADNPDLSPFKNRGGKLIFYHGGSDTSFSVQDTIDYYNAMNTTMGGTAQSFARLFVVPGMNHCSGGPATDNFNMFPVVANWVENGVAPDSVVATANNPGFFGVASRSRPLCPYPKQTRYKGTGDINVAGNFTCQ